MSNDSVNMLGLELGKLPPQATDLEELVIGSIMLEKEALLSIADAQLKPEHFYNDGHAEIYKAILKLSANSNPIDMSTVIDQLRKDDAIDKAGGAYKIADLTSKVASAANIEYYIRVIQEKYMLREIIKFTRSYQQLAFDDSTDVSELFDSMERDMFATNLFQSSGSRSKNAFELFKETVANLNKKKSTNGITGVPTGFRLLSAMTSGWQNSDLIILAARPGMGKTSFMLKTCREASGRQLPTAIFSLEMTSIQLMERLISIEHSIENDKMRSGRLQDEEWQRVVNDLPSAHGHVSLHKSSLFVDDTPALSIMDVRAKARRLHAAHGLKLIVIDYLQLMRGDKDKNGTREQEISSISRGLKGLAKELNIPIIALSQLSRSVETRGGDKRPMLSDLRESGSIEQDADLVAFLYRPEYYKITSDENGLSTEGMAEVIIEKHRNGGTGTVPVKFESHYTRFIDL